jgi:glycosyltransferase involved in cell wall biosynthesis
MSNTAIITSEFRFIVCKNGHVWTDSQYDMSFWARYLSVFEEVLIVARARYVDQPLQEWKRVDTPNIKLHVIPHYIGPLDMVKKYLKVKDAIQALAVIKGKFILRVPGVIGSLVAKMLLKNRKTFAVEVVGDPEEVFSKASSSHRLRLYFKWLFTKRLINEVQKSIGASYVTQSTLQKKYPVANGVYSTYYSSIELPNFFFELSRPSSTKLRLLFIGSLEQRYKGLHILLDALKALKDNGQSFDLTVVGDGRESASYKKQSEELAIQENVHFVGSVSERERIGSYFEQSDLFILPSLTEGLPRVVIESMAAGVPCIASNVGGVPELLPSDNIFEPNSVEALSSKLTQFTENPEAFIERAIEARVSAETYKTIELERRRNEFYEHIRKT